MRLLYSRLSGGERHENTSLEVPGEPTLPLTRFHYKSQDRVWFPKVPCRPFQCRMTQNKVKQLTLIFTA